MATSRRVGRGPVGGASDDAGVEYRRAVAAYAAACGLAGVHLPGVGIPQADAYVEVVALETEGAVDDIEVGFSSGWTASIQAKRTLRKGTALSSAVKQWVAAGRAGVDPSHQRLVIASGSLNGTMQQLRTALDRRRLSPAGPATAEQDEILGYVIGLLGDLTPQQRTAVLDAAVIWEIDVEEPDRPGAREALSHLRSSGYSIPPVRATAVWTELRAAAGRLARNRAGAALQGWLLELRNGGLVVELPGENPAGDLERRRQALERYYQRLVRESSEIDLRALGAKLPPLPLRGADAVTKVGTDPTDTRDTSDLLWAFLRVGRLVVTALPGGGKSTALKRLAGDLAHRLQGSPGANSTSTHYPFPVRASLRDINAQSHLKSFRDRMIWAATRDDSAQDRETLSVEIDRRLDRDLPIALLLDALDETHDDRAGVISDLHAFLQSVPRGACVLVTTRDVAYADAATLGWLDLRLLPPEEPTAPVGPLLCAAAQHLRVPEAEQSEWVERRKEWVGAVLSREPALRETPLTPLLLAILAIERTGDRLPQTRSEVLQDVVTTVVSRRELKRQDGQVLGPLSGSDLDRAATRAFAAEGSTILERNGVAPADTVTAAIAGTLATYWGLTPGHAESAGLDAVRFFDETGLFVIDSAASTVTARLALFSEIADAIHSTRDPLAIRDWVTCRVGADKIEPVVLAATLNDQAHAAMETAFLEDPGSFTLARGLLQARKDGAVLREHVITALREELVKQVGRGTPEGWAQWRALCDIGIPGSLRSEVITAASVHSPAHATLVKAHLDLEQRSTQDVRSSPRSMIDVLRLSRLPASPNGNPTRRRKGGTTLGSLASALGNPSVLADVQLRAAEVLIGSSNEVIDLIADLTQVAPHRHAERLFQLLEAHGHAERARHLRLAGAPKLGDLSWMTDFDDSRYSHLLELLSEMAPPRELSAEQAVRLGDLGDFLETMGLNGPGANRLYKQDDSYLRDILGLALTIFGFDHATVAAEAQVALERMNAEGEQGFHCYFSLFDFAAERIENDWNEVADVQAAVTSILRLFWLTRDQAHLAMKMLWGSSAAATLAVPRLRTLVEEVSSSPAHQRLVAITLISLTGLGQADSWAQSEDPVLRAVSACAVPAIEDGAITPSFKRLLFDEDGHVREDAINRISSDPEPCVDDVLSQLAQEAPGWMCLSCRTVNPSGLKRSCANEGCHASNPRPDEIARTALERRAENTPEPS